MYVFMYTHILARMCAGAGGAQALRQAQQGHHGWQRPEHHDDREGGVVPRVR